MPKDVIEHRGRICSVEGNCIKVRFVTHSACYSCHAKSVCSAADMKDKEVEVIDASGKFREGEEVNVLLRQSLGYKALFYGYVLPFVLLLTGLFSFSALLNSEVITGLLSLGILVPYYLVVYYSRNYFQSVFAFELEKLTEN